MADLRINGWSDERKLFDTSGEELISVSNCSGGFETRLYVHSSFAIILMGKRELVALLSLSSWCLVMVVWLFLVVPCVCLLFAIVVFSYFCQNLEPDLNPNCSSLYPVRTYYIRNQATGVSLMGRSGPVMGCRRVAEFHMRLTF